MEQINDSGVRAASRYPDITYWTYNWRKTVALRVCMKLQSEKSFINKNIWLCVFFARYQPLA